MILAILAFALPVFAAGMLAGWRLCNETQSMPVWREEMPW